MDSDFEVQKTLFGRVQTREQSEDRLKRWSQSWEEAGFGFWIFRDPGGSEVGHGGLFRSPRVPDSIEVGYALKPKFWNLGFATEITWSALQVGFEVLNLHRIIGIAQPENVASRRVLEKCGLRLESEYVSEPQLPSVRYAIEREAWSRGNPTFT